MSKEIRELEENSKRIIQCVVKPLASAMGIYASIEFTQVIEMDKIVVV